MTGFEADLSALASARHVVRTVVAEGGAPDEHSEVVALVASELLANAIVHGAPPFAFTISRRSAGTSVMVSDAGPTTGLGLSSSGCHGLDIVDRITNGVSVESTAAGKHVYAFVPRS